MLFTLILSALAGFVTPQVQPRLVEAALKVLDDDQLPKGGALDVAGFAVVMALAALVLILLGADPSPLLMLIGGFLGYFQAEIREAVTNRRA